MTRAVDGDTKTTAGAVNHLNVEEELAFYASYHSNKTNQLIHFICIPQILWSWLAILAHVPLTDYGLEFKPNFLSRGLVFQPNLALGFILIYMGYYIRLDPLGGLTYLPIGILSYLSATALAVSPSLPSWIPFTSSLKFAWTVFGFAWIAQFIGHGFFEHRAPALTENLVQALVTAPFFVHLEFLFTVFDYKPELHKRIKNKAGLRIRDMNKGKAAKLK